MSNNFYILEGKEAKPAKDILEWGKWFYKAKRIVKQTKVGDVKVSTVFLGINHSFGSGPPLLFETIIFGGDEDGYQERYSTWQQAEDGHKVACKLVRSSTKVK